MKGAPRTVLCSALSIWLKLYNLESHKSVRIQTPSAEYLYITEKRRACTAVILRKGYDRWKIFIVTAAVRCLNG